VVVVFTVGICGSHYVTQQEFVSWRLTSPFSTNMAISETIGNGELSRPSGGRPETY